MLRFCDMDRNKNEKNNQPLRPSSHLITRSALANTFGGIIRPMCLAVLRLITNSNFVGCSMGKSAGLVPLRILSTYVAARRKLSASSVAYDERHPLST